MRSTAVPNAPAKYGTVSGIVRNSPASRPGLDSSLFDPPSSPIIPNRRNPSEGGEAALASLVNLVDSWEISVGERKVVGADRSRKRQKGTKDASLDLTLYVTTATTALTLCRSLKQLADFDNKVWACFKDRVRILTRRGLACSCVRPCSTFHSQIVR
jgi:hypothetical protein